ncbi:ANTAR domain-containing protein [uncultured Nocardioides sp.]|uniref:ANTAR domain-containing protein n=1 Tax=uncultured Nocardioides sp. TaxID=198441 RepID=UPI00262A717D|nr:ANTAR domain-containing protein [uncultured Nocardioides sp.]
MTGRRTTPQVPRVGRVLAALSGEAPDVTDVLATLVVDCAETCGALAVAVLVGERGPGLELLAASSHTDLEMELWQAQHDSGPCVDAIDGSLAVHRTAVAEDARDATVGALMREAGFLAVSAYPVTWRGVTLAGLTLFWPSEVTEEPAPAGEPGFVYADLVALALAHPALDDPAAVRTQLRRALADRTVVEQAKGVLAWTEDLDMGGAYARLLELTAASAGTLTEVAAAVVRHRGAPPVG